MTEQQGTAFKFAFVVSMLGGLFLAWLAGVSFLFAWMGSFSSPPSSSGKVVLLAVFGLICLVPISTLIIGLSAWRSRPIPKWAAFVALVSSGIAGFIGLISPFFNFRLFLWYGAFLFLYAITSQALVKKYPKEAT